jgi:hypothetical protein
VGFLCDAKLALRAFGDEALDRVGRVMQPSPNSRPAIASSIGIR